MNKYRITFQRDYQVDIDAEGIQLAEKIGQAILTQFPKDTCKLLSIEALGEIAVAAQIEKPQPPFKPRGRPNGGGSPGTPVARREVLVDQIAQKVA